jgi:heat shock protein HslJ
LLKSNLYRILLMLGIVSLLVVGCAETPTTGDLEDTKWILESYGEPGSLQSLIAGTEITATFYSAEGEVRGSAGCNSYFGEYQTNGKLSIPVLAQTEMYCMEPEGVMEQEYEYLRTLSSAESFQIQDGKLQINCGEKILVYTEEEE